MKKTAVILLNIGGPDDPSAIRPFLINFFSDPAIIPAPAPIRWIVARLISKLRLKKTSQNYAALGGRSPLLENARRQAKKLENILRQDGSDMRCFPVMRYWRPFADEVLEELALWRPDQIVLLPAFPHYSEATTGSAISNWEKTAQKRNFRCPTFIIRSYPDLSGMIDPISAEIRQALSVWKEGAKIFFSAHALPERAIEKGDPYLEEVRESFNAFCRIPDLKDHEKILCFQSKIGPIKWVGPNIVDEIQKAGREKKGVIVVPLSFSAENSETLVELDLDYKKMALECGVPYWRRIQTFGDFPEFLADLAVLVKKQTR